MLDVGESSHVRREVLRQIAPQYREASSAHKRVIVEDFLHLTSSHRTYAMWLLNHAEEGQQTARWSYRYVYRTEVEEILVQVRRLEKTNGSTRHLDRSSNGHRMGE